MAYDSGLNGAAQRYFTHALRLAQAAGDRPLARDYYARLRALAADSDSERPELVQARAFVAMK